MTAPDPIAYIQRTRRYYQALGYGPPYEWARHKAVAFSPLPRALSGCRIAIVTTAAPFQPDKGDQGPGAPYNATAKFYQVYAGSTDTIADLRISHLAIDRMHTSARDIGTYFPLKALKAAEASNRIGAVAPAFFGLPTNRSQRTTRDVDAPDLVARCLTDKVDAAILVPNCPVCHQSVSLAAGALERAGIATVIMGCAKDIVEHAGVPRFLFSDFPLGNSAGIPHDFPSQERTLGLALSLLEQATGPRTTWQSPLVWPGPADWRDDYSSIDALSPAEIAEKRAAFDAGKAQAKAIRSGGI